MLFRSARILSVFSLLAFLVVAMLYLHGLPSTVQTGDTGELAANAYFYQISHPSGYPLFVNLQFVFSHLFSVGTVFYRIALLNSLFSLGTLLFLFFSSRNRWFGLGVTLCLAFSKLFWRYSELPDVLALNSFLAAGILFFYCRADLPARTRSWGSVLLFCAGLGNHLTLLFLAPLVLVTLWSVPEKKQLRLPIAAGLLLFLSTYASLMLMHPDRYYSWGQINSPGAVMRHFLREDYGHAGKTVQASAPPKVEVEPAKAPVLATAKKTSPLAGTQFVREVDTAWGQLLNAVSSREFRYYAKNFSSKMVRDFSPLLLFLVLFMALSLMRRERDWRKGILLGTIVLYCYVFFSLVKIEPVQENLEVVERFFILPQVMLCFLATRWLPEKMPGRLSVPALTLILMVQAGMSAAQNRAVTDYSNNTIVEDYARNLLQVVPEDRASIILADDDTQYFALMYCQQIFGLGPKATVVSAPLLFHPWYSKKLTERIPGFVFDAQTAQRSLHFNLEEDLLIPNLSHVTFLVSGRMNDSERFHLTYRALGRSIEVGKGEAFDESDRKKFLIRSTVDVIQSDPSEYDIFRRLYSEYAFYNLARGRASYAEGSVVAAQKEYLAALQKVPYCTPAAENLCFLQHSVGIDAANCQGELKRFRAANYNYYPQ